MIGPWYMQAALAFAGAAIFAIVILSAIGGVP